LYHVKALYCALMRPIILSALFLLGTVLHAQSQQTAKENITPSYNQCRKLLLSDTAYATEQSFRLTDDIKYTTDGPGYFKALTPEGTWPDINYHSEMRSAWVPCWHLYRLMLVYREYNKNHDPAYLSAVHKALNFWIKNDLLCSNWWQNQINIPYVYSSLMIMLDKDATAEELAYLDNVLTKRVTQKNPTGQNKIWQHDIEARIALVHRDEAGFKTAITNMQSVIQISTGEGIQPDYSFQQHGAMLQFGNYGMHFVNSLLFWMKVTANTPFAFDPARQKIMFDYCSKGLKYTIYKGAMDITAIGRQFRQDCAVKRGATLYDDFNLIRSFDKGDACKYNLDGLNANPNVCNVDINKSFWRSDYMVQLQSNTYMMSVKMHGPFVKKVESINSENLKGSFLDDGVTLIQHTGKEYKDIEPLWNWTMLPGITCDTTVDPSAKTTFQSNNQSDFVGQVSNGTQGISAMHYNRLGVEAYKSYFFVNNMMVALGAGIQSTNIAHVVTTVNQRYAQGKLIDGKTANGEKWLWQDSMAYIFPDKNEQVKSKVELTHGNWIGVDIASGDKPESGSLFSVYINHQQNSGYSYIVKPSVSLKEMKGTDTGIKVLVNTTAVQAIQANNAVMMVFYQPSTLTVSTGLKITVDKPCILICQKDKGSNKLWVSDPTRKQEHIDVMINNQHVPVSLPKGDYVGSSVQVL
jgi:chondroitin AC lyase